MNKNIHTTWVTMLVAGMFTLPVMADHHSKGPHSKKQAAHAKVERSSYEREVDQKMARLKKELAELENESAQAGRKAKRKFNKMKKNIAGEMDELEQEWTAFKDNAGDSWEDSKEAFQDSWSTFVDNFNEEKNELQKEMK